MILKETYYLISSVTTAMKAESILQQAGQRAMVFRDPGINPVGCGYVVRATGDREKMLELLWGRGIRVSGTKEVER
mgnify:FL=1